MGAIYFLAVVCGLELKRSRWSREFYSMSSIIGNVKFRVCD